MGSRFWPLPFGHHWQCASGTMTYGLRTRCSTQQPSSRLAPIRICCKWLFFDPTNMLFLYTYTCTYYGAFDVSSTHCDSVSRTRKKPNDRIPHRSDVFSVAKFVTSPTITCQETAPSHCFAAALQACWYKACSFLFRDFRAFCGSVLVQCEPQWVTDEPNDHSLVRFGPFAKQNDGYFRCPCSHCSELRATAIWTSTFLPRNTIARSRWPVRSNQQLGMLNKFFNNSGKPPESGRNLYTYKSAKSAMIIWFVTRNSTHNTDHVDRDLVSSTTLLVVG